MGLQRSMKMPIALTVSLSLLWQLFHEYLHMSKLFKLITLNMRSLLYVNRTS